MARLKLKRGQVRVKFPQVKQWHKTRWNGEKRHNDGLNTDRDMAYSSKCEAPIFEIQTSDIRKPPKGAS